MTVVADGITPIKYEWWRNGVPLPDTDRSSLTIPNVSAADAGVYEVNATLDAQTTVRSGPPPLAVIGDVPVVGDRAWITPSQRRFEPGMEVYLHLQNAPVATGAVQWYKDGTALPGATSTLLALNPSQAGDAGTYTATIGEHTSSSCVLSLNTSKPAFGYAPQSSWAPLGGGASFWFSFNYPRDLRQPSVTWYKDGVPFTPSSPASHQIRNVTTADYGEYTVALTNNAGTTLSEPFFLWPWQPPVVTREPVSQILPVGATLRLSVEVSGPAEIQPLTYEWRKDDVALPGRNAATLEIENVQEVHAGFYDVIVSGARGHVTSAKASVTVGFKNPQEGAITFASQPRDVSVAVGESTRFEVMVNGAVPISYQWMKDGVAVHGATASELSISSARLEDAGRYSVRATNRMGTVDSESATLTVTAQPPTHAPVITRHPAPVAAKVGDTVSFTFGFSLPEPQNTLISWRKNGLPIPNSNSTTLILTNVQKEDAGLYSAEVTILFATSTTQGALLTFEKPPEIAVQPGDAVVVQGETLVLGVTVHADPAPQYQWYKDGAPLPGATAATYSVQNVEAAVAGSYSVRASNQAGSVLSRQASVTVNARSTLAGIYFGTFGTGATVGEFALTVRPDGKARFIGYLNGSQTGLLADFVVLPSGHFEALVSMYLGHLAHADRFSPSVAQPIAAYAPAMTSMAGQIGGGVVSGTYGPSQQTFAGNAATGASDALSGDYSGALAGTANGLVYSIVGPDGRVMLLATDGATGTVAQGQTSSSGSFAIKTSTGEIAGAFDPKSKTLAGTVLQDGVTNAFSSVSSAVQPTDRLVNLSTRGYTAPGADVLIAGFVVGGSSPKSLLIRAIGPTLAEFGVRGAASDPTLVVFRDQEVIAENGDWGGSPSLSEVTARVGGFSLPGGSKDAVVHLTLEPGPYTVHVKNASTAGGVALVEVYDASPDTQTPKATRLVNISTRGRVGSGDQVMIAGFTIAGNVPKKVIARAVGPTLTTLGVPNALRDPKLDLFSANTRIATNDNWAADPAVIEAGGFAGMFEIPADSKDAALTATLAPGPYTVVISGVGGATGVALVEVYEIDN